MGYSRQRWPALHFTDLIDRGMERLCDHITATSTNEGIWRGNLLRRRRDGSTFPASCTVVALKERRTTVTHFVAVERDITEELQLRDQLVHTERLSAVGELVAGVAHEINNPLQTIVGCVELMLDDQKDPQTRRDLDVVRTGSRARRTDREKPACVRPPQRAGPGLSRPQSDRPGDRGPARVPSASAQYPTRRSSYDPGPLPVLVNREEILQIILNLVLNAEQAIASSTSHGTISIRTFVAGKLSVRPGERRRPGHQPRAARPDLRAVLQHQGSRRGNRPRPVDLARHRQRPRRYARRLRLEDGGACFRLTVPAQADSIAASSSDQRSPRSVGQLTRMMQLRPRIRRRRAVGAWSAPESGSVRSPRRSASIPVARQVAHFHSAGFGIDQPRLPHAILRSRSSGCVSSCCPATRPRSPDQAGPRCDRRLKPAPYLLRFSRRSLMSCFNCGCILNPAFSAARPLAPRPPTARSRGRRQPSCCALLQSSDRTSMAALYSRSASASLRRSKYALPSASETNAGTVAVDRNTQAARPCAP